MSAVSVPETTGRIRADEVVERLESMPAAVSQEDARSVVDTVVETLVALTRDPLFSERFARAQTSAEFVVVDAPEEHGVLSVVADAAPVEVVRGPLVDPEVRVFITVRDLALLWADQVPLTILIGDGRAGYTGPVRKLLRAMPILVWAVREHLGERAGALVTTAARLAKAATVPEPQSPTPRALSLEDLPATDLLDRAADYAGDTGVHEGVREFEERHPGEFWSIRCHNVHKAFGRNQVLRGLDFSIPEGLITVVLGPSGTGKSVLINHLIGLSFPDRGEIVVHGESLSDMRRSRLGEVRKEFGILFQDGALFGSMSMYDNVAFPLRQHTDRSEEDIRERVMNRLADVGLADHVKRMPNELSGGMKKRAGFARALMLDPSVVLFDEPDSGLDPVRTGLLCELIRSTHAQYGGTYVVITHDIASARQVAQYIAVLWKGQIVQAGAADEMFNSSNPFVHQFLNRDLDGPLGME